MTSRRRGRCFGRGLGPRREIAAVVLCELDELLELGDAGARLWCTAILVRLA